MALQGEGYLELFAGRGLIGSGPAKQGVIGCNDAWRGRETRNHFYDLQGSAVLGALWLCLAWPCRLW